MRHVLHVRLQFPQEFSVQVVYHLDLAEEQSVIGAIDDGLLFQRAHKGERTPGSDYKLFILFAEQVKSFHPARDICSGPLGGDETSWNLRKKFDFINKPLGK